MFNLMETWRTLKGDVLRHAYLYYIKNNPEITDIEYDKLFKDLKELEVELQIPEVERITTKVACGLKSNTFTKIMHYPPMLSLHNVFDMDNFADWSNAHNLEHEEVVVTPKLDGASLSLVYSNGTLVHALRRGDGTEGDEITAAATVIKGIPLTIEYNGMLIVRGEVMCPTYQEKFADKYKTHRNFVSGSLNLKKTSEIFGRDLEFIPYRAIDNSNKLEHTLYTESMDFLSSLGFSPVTEILFILTTVEDFDVSSYELFLEVNYPIDGLVVTLNNLEKFDELGSTSHHPRGAVAFKLAQEIKESTILDVEWQVGKSGTVTPVAILDPVVLDNTTVSKATLHNINEINNLEVAINDTVMVIKAAGIIPKIIAVTNRPTNRIEISIGECPSCGTKLIQEGAYLKCTNKMCDDQFLKTVIRFVEVLKIKGLGKQTVKKLIEAKKIRSLDDIFTLTFKDISNTISSDKVAEKLLREIDGAKERATFAQTIAAINIPGVSISTAKKLIAAGFRDINALKSREELEKINGIGKKTAANIADFVKSNLKMLERLKQFIPMEASGEVIAALPEEGLTKIAITGKIGHSRNEAKELLYKHGYLLVNSVTTDTAYLIIGDKPGSEKIDKAKKYGIRMVHYKGSEFENLV